MSTNSVKDTGRLSLPFPTLDPFLFAVYHKDDYPEGDDKMQAPRTGDGADFDPSAPYRMYHGDKIPGFPMHPHRGFETLTATTEGLVDHADSMGNAGRYGDGDLQFMTAGRGINHAENFPLLKQDKPNPLRLFQLWLNSPKKNKLCDPDFKMFWSELIPKIKGAGTCVTVFCGAFGATKGLVPPVNSWSHDENNDVGVFLVDIEPGASLVIPPARIGAAANRRLYVVEGERVVVDGARISATVYATLDAALASNLSNDATVACRLLILQGRPIGEPVVQRGPFVMNTREEIIQTMLEYQSTSFGGWPWPADAVVFPRDKGRFALKNGVEERPPKN